MRILISIITIFALILCFSCSDEDSAVVDVNAFIEVEAGTDAVVEDAVEIDAKIVEDAIVLDDVELAVDDAEVELGSTVVEDASAE